MTWTSPPYSSQSNKGDNALKYGVKDERESVLRSGDDVLFGSVFV